jgi:ABC-type glycerol-3-phosphate transport system substrate-binding protein
VIVEYWEKWTGNEEAQMRQIVDAFNDTVGRERGIFVRYLSTSAIDKKTLVATAAGAPPDIAGLWDSNIAPYAARDALEPLDELARDAGLSESSYKRAYWDACHYKGKLYALVSTPGVVALLYNRVAFEAAAPELRAAGLDPNRAPRTLAEFDAYADVLTKRDPRRPHPARRVLPARAEVVRAIHVDVVRVDVWDERTEQLRLTDPKVVAAFDWIASYARKYGRDASSDFSGGFGNVDSPQNPFLTGTVPHGSSRGRGWRITSTSFDRTSSGCAGRARWR